MNLHSLATCSFSFNLVSRRTRDNTVAFLRKRNFGTHLTHLSPREIVFGRGSLQQLPRVLQCSQVQRPLLVTDKSMESLGYVDEVKSLLRGHGVELSVFSDTIQDPTTDVINKGLQTLIEGSFDAIIALGGGSPIDTAKGMSILAENGGNITDYKVPKEVPGGKLGALPLVAVPTTAGTGSEVTRFAVVTDSATGEKMLLSGEACVPSAAIVDPELTKTLPFRVAADTGIDALTHAIEAFVSKKANAFSDMYALSAMRLVYQNLESACLASSDMVAKEKVMVGATQAGLAFSASSVALVHGMSRPLSAHFHVPHGLSNAMLLLAVINHSLEKAPINDLPHIMNRYARCAKQMGIVNDQTDVHDESAVQDLLSCLRDLLQTLEVPTPQEYGIDEDQYFSKIDLMTKQCVASGSPNNNPTILSQDSIKTIYEEVYKSKDRCM